MGSNRFPVDMPRLVDFYMTGKLKLDEMISRRIKLDEVNDAFDELKQRRDRPLRHHVRRLKRPPLSSGPGGRGAWLSAHRLTCQADTWRDFTNGAQGAVLGDRSGARSALCTP